VETLKDYAIKALVNTVDHLGSVTYKVNDFVDEKVDEVAGTELRVSCIEQVSIILQMDRYFCFSFIQLAFLRMILVCITELSYMCIEATDVPRVHGS